MNNGKIRVRTSGGERDATGFDLTLLFIGQLVFPVVGLVLFGQSGFLFGLAFMVAGMLVIIYEVAKRWRSSNSTEGQA